MRLSEAMRLGAMLGPQAFGGAYNNGGTCAIAAALEAVGAVAPVTRSALDAIQQKQGWWWPDTQSATCPACSVIERWTASSVMAHLNDHHHWTRERIADWVATIEPSDVPALSHEEAEAITALDPQV